MGLFESELFSGLFIGWSVKIEVLNLINFEFLLYQFESDLEVRCLILCLSGLTHCILMPELNNIILRV